MKKRFVFPLFGVAVIGGAVCYVMGNERLRNKANQLLGVIGGKNQSMSYPSTIIAAGIPDQVEKGDLEQLQNTKMVSEGSQYGVSYYYNQQNATH
mgnify:CR=1 FL=1